MEQYIFRMHGQQIHPSGQMVGNPLGNATVVPSATIIIAQPPSQTKVENYKCEAAVRLGICQIALGILAIGLNVNTDLSHPTLSPSKRIISYLQISVFIEMIRI